MSIRHAYPFAYLCICHQTMRSLHTLNHPPSSLPTRKTSRTPRYSQPENLPPEASGGMTRWWGDGDQLDDWDYINNIGWIHWGSKLWITDSEVCERGSGESDIPWESLSFRCSIMISILSTLEPSAAFSSIGGLILLSLVTSKGENLER